ncbi:MAG: hypothetical protein IPG45_34025 [Deltaproteobacteria bacterium]|jgi:uncharacterized membrane protein|nr:hypothetical protein [Deltaproteobacteria bacterium]
MSMSFDDERPDGYSPDFDNGDNAHRIGAWVVAGLGFLGAAFSAVSTRDFIQHLDRQMHSIHCSFIPGAGTELGESGCRTVMMSPYSSMFRTSLWGGLPISLLSMAVFAYLAYRGADLALSRQGTRTKARYLIAATVLPVLMSLIYGYISAFEIDALCKVCAGIYLTSFGALGAAIFAYSKTQADEELEDPMPKYLGWFFQGVGYVAFLTVIYVGFAPTTPKSAEGCSALVRGDDPNNILVPLQPRKGGVRSIAVLDPLCPACKGFDERLEKSGLYDKMDLSAVLFPLDASCNWMVKQSLHPGACAVSEAMLCLREKGRTVLDWAFLHQEELTKAAKDGDGPVRERLAKEFPEVKGCLGTPAIKQKLNKSLRWGVNNAIPVLTPQLFVGNRRVCDEDTDLGLEYTLTAMIEKQGGKK